ncbi:MAG: diguanylate cyclase [Candidatus Omnitrophica bacterium]|nr:diguanylate cyclase [Candidatus Omnitrophota bacterium]
MAKRTFTAGHAVLIAVLCCVVYRGWVVPSGAVDLLRLQTLDTFTRAAQQHRPMPSETAALAIVVIDDETLASLGAKWPWPASMTARLLTALHRAGARLILWNLPLPGEGLPPDEQSHLAEALREARPVIIGAWLREGLQPLVPGAALQEASAGVGLVEKPADGDATVRRSLVTGSSVAAPRARWTSEVLATALLRHEAPEQLVIPRRADGTFWIHYLVRPERLTVYSASRFAAANAAAVPDGMLQDKIVLVGLTSKIMHEIDPTPIGPMPRVFIMANTLLTLWTQAWLREVPALAEWALLLLVSVLAAWVGYAWPMGRALAGLTGLLVGLGAACGLAARHHWLWDVASAWVVTLVGFAVAGLGKYVAVIVENAALKEAAITDGLTGLYTYRYLSVVLRYELARARRYHTPLSLLILDLDLFKRINDTYGHAEGNVVLKMVAQTIRQATRRVDLAARYGGEEFCLVQPFINLDGALVTAERLRKTIESLAFVIPGQPEALKVTVSIGVTTYPRCDAATIEDFVDQADQALYAAKRSGRNKVCLYNASALPATPPPVDRPEGPMR